jgi:5-formyltetrahydrofolate cyclo-ligase
VRGMSEARARKAELRARLLKARRGLTADERLAAGAALDRSVRELPELASAGTVAAYVSMGTEPGTRALVDALHGAGVRVLLPVLLPDNDLDWAEYHGPAALERTPRGLLEPTGHPLGPAAVTEAQAVVLPGLAVDATGLRLGRGGGSYDRVLARLRACGTRLPLMVLLYGHEVVESLPRERHDHLVDVAITPERVHRFPG